MTKYYGGHKVKPGMYLNLRNGELVEPFGTDLVLPGTDITRYVKVPMAIAVVGGPLVGLVFIIFVPAVGIMGTVGFLIFKAGRALQTLGRRIFQPATMEWKPGHAYFTRTETKPGEGLPGDQKELTKLEEDITKRREQGEK